MFLESGRLTRLTNNGTAGNDVDVAKKAPYQDDEDRVDRATRFVNWVSASEPQPL